MGIRATGLQSFKHVILFFFGMGTMVDFLKHEGTTDRERERLRPNSYSERYCVSRYVPVMQKEPLPARQGHLGYKNLANVEGDAHRPPHKFLQWHATRPHAQEEATPLVELAHTPMGHCSPRKSRLA